MRGLTARVELAKAKFTATFDMDKAELLLWDSMQSAYADGVSDFNQGHHKVPPLFKGEPMLVDAWRDGYVFAQETRAMTTCSGCNNGSCNPCPVHG